MENIFENAYYGKPYKTRDGRKAIYIKEILVHESLSHTDILYAQLVLETGDILEVVKEIGVSNGTQPIYDNLDIISEWQEEISEEELMDLSCASFPCDGDTDARSFHKGFKAGYRKALEK